jgi:hypothetical protein
VHGAGVADDAARPVEHALALRREARKARAAVDEADAETLLELLDRGRERRLAHPAGLRGAADMPLACEGDEELQPVEHISSGRDPIGPRGGAEGFRGVPPAELRRCRHLRRPRLVPGARLGQECGPFTHARHGPP